MDEPPAQRKHVLEHDDRYYSWERFSPEDAGLLAIRLTDVGTQTALTVTPDENIRRAAHRAWAGARQSRAPGTTIQILAEMGLRGVDPDQKLEETFRNHGHASVADMARFEVHFHNVPGHIPLLLFHLGRTNSGQEKSTRYQSAFGKATLHPLRHYIKDAPRRVVEELEREYQAIGTTMQERFRGTFASIVERFTERFAPASKQEESALKSRALDTARSLLLFGTSTGCTYETSAREWTSRIASLRAMPGPYHQRLADHLEYLLAPPAEIEEVMGFKAEAPSLIRHTAPDATVGENLRRLEERVRGSIPWMMPAPRTEQSQGVAMLTQGIDAAGLVIAQYLTAAIENVDLADAVGYVLTRSSPELQQLSAIVFAGHTHQREPPQIADTTGLGAVLTMSLGEARDLNRHRAFARYINGWSFLYGAPCAVERAKAIMDDGFVMPLYLDIPGFEAERQRMIDSLQEHYDLADRFIDKTRAELGDADYGWFMNLLPMAHRVDLVLHGTPHQLHYMTHLRVREGGHINYRALAYDLNKRVADANPALEGIRLRTTIPDPANREEFFSRK